MHNYLGRYPTNLLKNIFNKDDFNKSKFCDLDRLKLQINPTTGFMCTKVGKDQIGSVATTTSTEY